VADQTSPSEAESRLADAEHAIGNVIRYAESLKMRTYRQLDAAEVADVLLAICAQWTGGLIPAEQPSLTEAHARLAALDASLPEGADKPLTPGLVAAFVVLQDAASTLGTIESSVDGYRLVSDDDIGALDEASEAVEDLLNPPTTDEEEAHRG
jgi:hypothetical protein